MDVDWNHSTKLPLVKGAKLNPFDIIEYMEKFGAAMLSGFAVDGTFLRSNISSFVDPQLFDAEDVKGYHGMTLVGFRFVTHIDLSGVSCQKSCRYVRRDWISVAVS
jgi:hypothetical protein